MSLNLIQSLAYRANSKRQCYGNCRILSKYRPTNIMTGRIQIRGCSTNRNSPTLLSMAHTILSSKDPFTKSRISQEAFKFLKQAHQSTQDVKALEELIGDWQEPPHHPGRPSEPILLQPKEMPSYRSLGMEMSAYLLHGLAHIELNAIDTAWDTMLRFSKEESLPLGFYVDFASIAADESRHFELLCQRLQARGLYYGSIPAHVAIWDDAEKTKSDLLGRLTVIQLVQEPRALDSWSRLVEKFKSQSDKESSRLVDMICREEVDHVKKGVRWFKYLCERQQLDPVKTFHEKVGAYVGIVPPPFNVEARDEAGMTPDWYLPISKRGPSPASVAKTKS